MNITDLRGTLFETLKGIKDADKIHQFVAAVRAADPQSF